ncbi:MAG: hypothetical protein HOW73_46225 [Polyangiaceae bacterium]|nr:hypothetical protein [Polyangiaceae bacterium]
MSSSSDVHVTKDGEGRYVARSTTIANCIGYGSTESEALEELQWVREDLTRPNAPQLVQEADGMWLAQSSVYPIAVGRGATPAEALAKIREEELVVSSR